METFLAHLDRLDGDFEVIVVDGGSDDGTAQTADRHAIEHGNMADRRDMRVVHSHAGRAHQMNAGAQRARGHILLFLHVDTFLPACALVLVSDAMSKPGVAGGRFKVRMSDSGWQYRLVEAGINFRDALTGGFTGDQAIFISRETFEALGGFPEIALCEDVEFVRRLRQTGRLVSLTPPVTTSSRRYRRWGPFRTAARMWMIKSLYLAGMPADRLAALYPDVR